MAAPSGILAILAKGKGKPAPGGDGAPSPDKEDSVGQRAAQDMLDAIDAHDAAALYDALERGVKACSGESDAAPDDMGGEA